MIERLAGFFAVVLLFFVFFGAFGGFVFFELLGFEELLSGRHVVFVIVIGLRGWVLGIDG